MTVMKVHEMRRILTNVYRLQQMTFVKAAMLTKTTVDSILLNMLYCSSKKLNVSQTKQG